MKKYAEGTTVPVDRSKAEIERILNRYGAAGFGYMTKGNQAAIMFLAHGKQIRFILPLPSPDEFKAAYRKSASERYQQELKRRWRAITLAIKAKLEVVQTGITEFEKEFLAYIVLPNGQTVAETVLPAIEESYRTGKVQALLPGW
jgi:hypothetical protein